MLIATMAGSDHDAETMSETTEPDPSPAVEDDVEFSPWHDHAQRVRVDGGRLVDERADELAAELERLRAKARR
jgi:hypothetical protein